MKTKAIKKAFLRLPETPSFRKAEPLHECARVLGDRELARAFSVLHPIHGQDLLSRFEKARADLRSRFSVDANVVEKNHLGLRFEARLELVTDHKTIDDSLFDLVAGMGFDLTLSESPITGALERRYIVTPGRHSSPDLSSAASGAEDLLRLASMLVPEHVPQKLPDNVVDLAKARRSKPLHTQTPEETELKKAS